MDSPSRGPWLDHRSPTDAYGLTRFALPNSRLKRNPERQPRHSNHHEFPPPPSGQDSCRCAARIVDADQTPHDGVCGNRNPSQRDRFSGLTCDGRGAGPCPAPRPMAAAAEAGLSVFFHTLRRRAVLQTVALEDITSRLHALRRQIEESPSPDEADVARMGSLKSPLLNSEWVRFEGFPTL